MAASSAGVFWRAARPGELAYGHTRTHFLEGGRGGRLISPAGPREGGRGGGTRSLKGGDGPPAWQKNTTRRGIARQPVAPVAYGSLLFVHWNAAHPSLAAFLQRVIKPLTEEGDQLSAALDSKHHGRRSTDRPRAVAGAPADPGIATGDGGHGRRRRLQRRRRGNARGRRR